VPSARCASRRGARELVVVDRADVQEHMAEAETFGGAQRAVHVRHCPRSPWRAVLAGEERDGAHAAREQQAELLLDALRVGGVTDESGVVATHAAHETRGVAGVREVERREGFEACAAGAALGECGFVERLGIDAVVEPQGSDVDRLEGMCVKGAAERRARAARRHRACVTEQGLDRGFVDAEIKSSLSPVNPRSPWRQSSNRREVQKRCSCSARRDGPKRTGGDQLHTRRQVANRCGLLGSWSPVRHRSHRAARAALLPAGKTASSAGSTTIAATKVRPIATAASQPSPARPG